MSKLSEKKAELKAAELAWEGTFNGIQSDWLDARKRVYELEADIKELENPTPKAPKAKAVVKKAKDAVAAPSSKPVSKAVQVRELIALHPKASANELITLVIGSDIDIPDGRVKVYVNENIKRVRG